MLGKPGSRTLLIASVAKRVARPALLSQHALINFPTLCRCRLAVFGRSGCWPGEGALAQALHTQEALYSRLPRYSTTFSPLFSYLYCSQASKECSCAHACLGPRSTAALSSRDLVVAPPQPTQLQRVSSSSSNSARSSRSTQLRVDSSIISRRGVKRGAATAAGCFTKQPQPAV